MNMHKDMTLAALLSPWLDISTTPYADIAVTELVLDSRKVSQGSSFIAIKGHAVDGRQFVESAVKNGANVVLAQADERNSHGFIELVDNTPVIFIQELNQHLSQLAAQLYPIKNNQLIGVTGTNGKTTITQIIAQWVDLIGQRAAVLGTAGNGFLSELKPAVNTTGSAIDIQKALSELEMEGADVTAMEISSHGLVQHRVKALPFAVGVFTNLSRDHLDYHGTMEEYAKAKFSLFTQHDCQHAVINIDDEVGARWAKTLTGSISVSLQPTVRANAVYATNVDYSESGISLSFDGLYGQGSYTAPLIGEFNASNILVAMTALLAFGVKKEQLIQTASQLKPVVGRMELFAAPNRAKVVVDYAHTPDALEKALKALRIHCHGKLWAIFGCGGDRDKGKRPMMAEIGERLADKIIISDDNPRSEPPQAIVADMLDGLIKPDGAIVEHDRYKALELALEQSKEGDIILLAGKGHEDYQVLATETIHYSDRESAMQLLGLTK